MNNDFLPRRGKRPGMRSQPPVYSSSTPLEQPEHFRTPEAVAAADDRTPEVHQNGAITSHHGPTKKSLKQRLRELTRKQWAILIVAAVVLLGLIGFGVYYVAFRDDAKPATKKAVTPAKPTVSATPSIPTSTLTGLPITDPALNERPVTAIMIENSADARPQSGLTDAGVVFEAVAEGGITRFLTLWQDTDSEYIGPVRSARPYYLQWLQGFDGAIAHAGGSPDALSIIKSSNIKDLDQFHNAGAYWRITERYAPHNLYTSTSKLHALEASKGFGKAIYTGFARKLESVGAAPTARTIDFNISGALYNSHYDYDTASNSYLRSEGGAPHKDQKSGQQIQPKVVVGLVMPQGKNGVYTTYNSIGTGRAYVFQDGIVTICNWSKTSDTSNFTFKDDSGAVVKLNPGKTWLTVVGGTDRISYKP
jgi:hypothetical protein